MRKLIWVFVCAFLFTFNLSVFSQDQQQSDEEKRSKSLFKKKEIEKKKEEKKEKEKEKIDPLQIVQPTALVKVEDIKIPEEYGNIKEAWSPSVLVEGAKNKIIIYIQDAHCVYEAQMNIKNILDRLMSEYPEQVKFAAVEGSVGMIDTSPFAEFSDAEIKKEVADYFMKKGKITGPEFLSITGDHKFTIYGIETKELYDKNYKAFMDSLPFRDESEKHCAYMQDILEQLKQKVYSDELKDFDKKIKEHEEGDMNFLDYASVLRKLADERAVSVDQYPNFKLLAKTQNIEKTIDFNIVEKERSALINKMGTVLQKKDVDDLILKSMNFRTGKLNPQEYYNYLKKVIEANKSALNVAEFSNLMQYIDYVDANYTINKTALFEECAKVENDIAEKMFKDDDQRKIFTLSKHVGIYRRMFKLELVKEDYAYYKTHQIEFRVQAFVDVIKVLAGKYGITFTENPELVKIDANLPIIESFYEAALERDPVLVQNMLDEMEKENVTVSILVTGGFHTKGISDILKEKGISYVLISPKITKIPEYNPYLDVMTNKKTPFEEFLDQLGEGEEED